MSEKKWLVTNGIGGFCLDVQPQSTSQDCHLFYLPVKPPLQIRAMIHRLHDQVHWQGNWVSVGYTEPDKNLWKTEYNTIEGLPVFKFFNPFFSVEKMLYMLPGKNSLFLRYLLSESSHEVAVRFCPSIPLKNGAETFSDWRLARKYTTSGAAFNLDEQGDAWLYFHSEEAVEILETNCWQQKKDSHAPLYYQPFAFEILLQAGQPVTFEIGLTAAPAAGAESKLEQEIARRLKIRELAAKKSGSELIASHAVSAAAYLVDVPTKKTRSHLALVSSFPQPKIKICDMLKCTLGLLLCPGNIEKSRQILRSVRSNAENGVIQSLTNPLQNGVAVEAGLWYCNAVFTHWLVEKNDQFLIAEYPFLLSIFNAYARGAIKGCYIDENDSLLVIDTSVKSEKGNGFVRWNIAARGEKRVEIQALFYNALCIVLDIASRLGKKDGIVKLEAMHAKFHKHFLKKFWLNDRGYLADSIENSMIDNSFRSAQLQALALPFSPLSQKKNQVLLNLAKKKLCTSYGVLTLEKMHPAFMGEKFTGEGDFFLFNDQGNISLWATKLYILAALKNGEKSKDLISLFDDLFKLTVASGHLFFAPYRSGNLPHEVFGAGISALATASLMEMIYALHADNSFSI